MSKWFECLKEMALLTSGRPLNKIANVKPLDIKNCSPNRESATTTKVTTNPTKHDDCDDTNMFVMMMDDDDDHSLDVHAMELSGPR
ncbi:hypothetical protein IFM89_031872 [Coptis chinensis]|uniref:Uncharacterized protein n=1 Tax=Coptis chinensis TaxID=261450 RepID=A0A835IVR3_9MAGN|nr:hypothetical protein IFM89_031872 [Coptis chinensis]